jgi:hypothetical protein
LQKKTLVAVVEEEDMELLVHSLLLVPVVPVS